MGSSSMPRAKTETAVSTCPYCGGLHNIVFKAWVQDGRYHEQSVVELCCGKAKKIAEDITG